MTMIQLRTPEGQEFDAYFARAGKQDAPGLVLIQEIFGINHSMRQLANQWSALGFNVLVPDLFWRHEPGVVLEPRIETEFARGVELMQATDQDVAVQDLDLARQWLVEHIGHDRVAAQGYCFGGRLVVRVSAETPVKCGVSYYGVGLEDIVPGLPESTPPVLLHIAELDGYVPADVRIQLLEAAKGRQGWEAHVYEGCDHAFARPDGAHWVADAARLAQERSLAFIQRHLG